VDEEPGFCLASQIQSVRNKLISLEALAHLRGATDQTCAKIRKFRNDIVKTNDKRNRAVHDPIYLGMDFDRPVASRMFFEKKLVREEEQLSVEEL
jgi:hypothetical protein